MNGESVVDVPLQDLVSEFFRILTCSYKHNQYSLRREVRLPTTAKLLLEKNLIRGSVAMMVTQSDDDPWAPDFKA